MKAHTKSNHVSPEAYLETEETAEGKSEYFYGEIFAMGGASLNHNIIAVNTTADIHRQIRNSSCFVFGSDMKIQVEEDRHYAYPDFSIVCGEIEFAKNRHDTVANPVVIAEILSASTQDDDRGSKFTAYRKIRSLKEYLLIDQYSCHVEHFHKNDRQWVLTEYADLEDTILLSSIKIELPLNIVYDRVTF